MKTPHPHAAAMLLYAEDAAETDTPWERWEFSRERNSFRPCFAHPEWYENHQYRRKPKTITVNGVEVPEPIREELKNIERYYLAYPISEELYAEYYWTGAKPDKLWLEKGLIHSTKEAAIAHAKAMLAPSQRNQNEH